MCRYPGGARLESPAVEVYLIGGALAFTMKDIRLLGQKSLIGVTLMSVEAGKAHRRRLLTILLEITENVKFFLPFL
jgi:hypothetical protein